jgi:hypothetical protein
MKTTVMKKIIKSFAGVLACISIFIATTAYFISDPEADFKKQRINYQDRIQLSKIKTTNSDTGAFKSSIQFKQDNGGISAKEFYGQEIIISNNQKLDRILIGVTNNQISRMEIWNKNNLVETAELGFMGKMTWGEIQNLTVDFYDQRNYKYKGKSNIAMRFFSGAGFFGDIGTINVDLTEYGDLSGNKSVGIFAKSIDSKSVNKPEFSNFKIWKNYKSFD